MTPEQRDLLITDICARLPYNVRIIDIRGIRRVKASNLDALLSAIQVYESKPILFPLSAINEKIEIRRKRVIVKREINKRIDKGSYYIDAAGNIDMIECSYVLSEDYINILDTFNRYHIDYRGLIDKGLAISVFDLAENPYRI